MYPSHISDTYSPKETAATLKYLQCLIARAQCAFQFRPTLLSNVWNLKQFSAKTLIILINFGLKSAIFNLVLGPVHMGRSYLGYRENISTILQARSISPCYDII